MKKTLLIVGTIILFIIVVVIATNQDKMDDSFQDGMGAAKGTIESMEK